MEHHKSKASRGKQKKNEQKKIPRKITKTYLHNAGLYYLERFAASKEHFKTVMKRKAKRSCMYHKEQDYNTCVELVNQLADQFEQSGILNDTVYTASNVNALRRKGVSHAMIIRKMTLKGISEENTRHALESHNADLGYEARDIEIQSALILARKKKLGPFNRSEEQNNQKALGVFARAGFSYDIAKKILDMTEEEYEEHYGTIILNRNFHMQG